MEMGINKSQPKVQPTRKPCSNWQIQKPLAVLRSMNGSNSAVEHMLYFWKLGKLHVVDATEVDDNSLVHQFHRTPCLSIVKTKLGNTTITQGMFTYLGWKNTPKRVFPKTLTALRLLV